MAVPGHKQRQDLTGAVTVGDAPLYGGLDTIKHADALLADAEDARRPAVGRGLVPVLGGRLDHGNQALALAVGSPGQECDRHPVPAPGRCCSGWCWRAAAGLGAARSAHRGPARRGSR
jgi:hypothetical protein